MRDERKRKCKSRRKKEDQSNNNNKSRKFLQWYTTHKINDKYLIALELIVSFYRIAKLFFSFFVLLILFFRLLFFSMHIRRFFFWTPQPMANRFDHGENKFSRFWQFDLIYDYTELDSVLFLLTFFLIPFE